MLRNKCVQYLTVLLGCMPFLGCQSAPQRPTAQVRGDYTYARDYMRWYINKTMNKQDIVGLSIALIDDQKVIWSEGFGWADKDKKIKATDNTPYQVGSNTKLFTSIAAMQLAEQGKIDINAPLQQYLPEFSMRSREVTNNKVTPRNIMTHHSGLPSNYMNGMWCKQPESFTTLVGKLKDDYLAQTPDTLFRYSNLGMTLLGHMVQEVSGEQYAQYIQDHLLTVMGMKDSYVATTLDESKADARAYFQGKAVGRVPLRDLPAGALVSTVNDMSKFVQMVFANGQAQSGSVLQADTLKKMLSYHDGEAVFDLQPMMGLGWVLSKPYGDAVGLVAGHGGSTVLNNTMLSLVNEHKLGVVVLSNSDTAFEAVGEIAKKALQLALETKTGIEINDNIPPMGKTIAADPEDLSNMPGRYASLFGIIDIKADADKLGVTINDENEELDLVRKENGQYYLDYKIMGWSLNLDELKIAGFNYHVIEGNQVLIMTHNGNKDIVAKKLVTKNIPPSWLLRVGEYEPVNSKAGGVVVESFELAYEDEVLVMRIRSRWPFSKKASTASYALNPVNLQEAVVVGLWDVTGDTLRFVKRDEEYLLEYQGYLLRPLSRQ